MPRPQQITVKTLADLGNLTLAAACDNPACRRVVDLDVPTLQATLRVDYPLNALQRGLVCTGCGARYPVAHLLMSGAPDLKDGVYRPH